MKEDDLKSPPLFSKGKNGEAILILHGFTGNVSQLDVLYKYFCAKGFTVARPVLPGHGKDIDLFLQDFTIQACQKEALEWFNKLAETENKISIVGLSFGGNLSASLASLNHPKLKCVVVMEMPIMLKLKFYLWVYGLMPVLQLFGMKYIRKNKLFWRKNYENDSNLEAFSYLPFAPIREVFCFIHKQTKGYLKKITKPFLIVNSQKSDLLANDNARTIYDLIPHTRKGVLYVPVDNHDLNLMDDAGKMLMMEKMLNFIKDS